MSIEKKGGELEVGENGKRANLWEELNENKMETESFTSFLQKIFVHTSCVLVHVLGSGDSTVDRIDIPTLIQCIVIGIDRV